MIDRAVEETACRSNYSWPGPEVDGRGCAEEIFEPHGQAEWCGDSESIRWTPTATGCSGRARRRGLV